MNIKTFIRTVNSEFGFGSVVYPAGGTLLDREQRHYQLVTIHTGSLDLMIDGIKMTIPRGQVFLMVPGHRYDFYFNTARATWHTWIDYYKFTKPKTTRVTLADPFLQIPLSGRMESVLQSFQVFSRDRITGTEALCRHLAALAMELFGQEARLSGPDPRPVSLAVQKAVSFIHENLGNDLSLADIAESAFVGREHLIRIFKKAGYPAPVTYLWQQRSDLACELLRSTGLDFSEICRQTGFKSPYHFSRKIKEHTGYSPRRYRRISTGRS